MNENPNEFQKGNESALSSIQRLLLHTEWLNQQHKDVKDKILQRNKPDQEEEPPVQGFPKD
jgi:hypothetical protein